jgi:membrane protein
MSQFFRESTKRIGLIPKALLQSLRAFMHNDLTTSAAAISYFTMLALFPTLLFLLTIGNRILGPEVVQKYLMGQVLAFLPGAQTFVRKNLESISNINLPIIISSLLVMLWAASWLFTVIEKALNRIYDTSPRSFLRGRLVNFVIMSAVLSILAASAVFTAFITATRSAAQRLPIRLAPWFAALSGFAWQTVFVVASVALTIALLTILYKWMPNDKIATSEALPGAVLAGVLWEGAKFAFALLLPYLDYDVLYGSIGVAVALLSWVYLSSNIMLFGGQFTALLHRVHLMNRSRNSNGNVA